MTARTWCFDASQSHWTRARGCVDLATAAAAAELGSSLKSKMGVARCRRRRWEAWSSVVAVAVAVADPSPARDGRKETGYGGVDFLDALALAFGEIFQLLQVQRRLEKVGQQMLPVAPLTSHDNTLPLPPSQSSHEPRPPLPLPSLRPGKS